MLVLEGDSAHVISLPVSGAPGPAEVVGVKGDLVLISQGRGYFVYNMESGEVDVSDEHANPGRATIIR